jgi:hypothetical protein
MRDRLCDRRHRTSGLIVAAERSQFLAYLDRFDPRRRRCFGDVAVQHVRLANAAFLVAARLAIALAVASVTAAATASAPPAAGLALTRGTAIVAALRAAFAGMFLGAFATNILVGFVVMRLH